MTINSILDKLEKNRKQNQINKDFENITKTLDNTVNSNKLVKNIPGLHENIYNNALETKSSLFTYKSDVFSATNIQKQRSIYYPVLSNRVQQSPLLYPLHPPPTIKKKRLIFK